MWLKLAQPFKKIFCSFLPGMSEAISSASVVVLRKRIHKWRWVLFQSAPTRLSKGQTGIRILLQAYHACIRKGDFSRWVDPSLFVSDWLLYPGPCPSKYTTSYLHFCGLLTLRLRIKHRLQMQFELLLILNCTLTSGPGDYRTYCSFNLWPWASESPVLLFLH